MTIEQINIDKVLAGLKQAATQASNEEELRIRASALLEKEVISKLGITLGKYEYTFVSGKRADALYGHVIIEYKASGRLSRKADIAKSKEQLIGYIKNEAKVEEQFKLFLGVILAEKIAFVRYDSKEKSWLIRGPYEINRESVLRLIEAIRGLGKKKLAVDNLLKDFGPSSPIAIKAVNAFYHKINNTRNPKVEALFNDWKRLFSQVCAYSPKKLKGLEKHYGMGGAIDYGALLFAIHTYYALLMKLLAAEIAYLFGAGKWLRSYVAELEDARMRNLEEFKSNLEDLESGGIFRKLLNVTNFIEGNYFSWYLEELDQEMASAISSVSKELSDYEPATPVLEPEYTRDLLKRLYQNLIPKKIRHDLGEYYTPDWLAELLLKEIGLTTDDFEKLGAKSDLIKPLNLRVLDPACGSGTFLVLTIKRFRDYAERHFMKDILINYLLRNVVGFDLNPLAVLAARTNYILAIADLFGYVKGSIEIPIYLADSLLVETRTTLTGVSYAIKTYAGLFELPKSIVDRGFLSKVLEAIDTYVRLKYKSKEFKRIMKAELGLKDDELLLVGELYKTFLKLEEEGKDHVWASIIRNAFAPLTIVNSYGKFDYVVGNPPWINWENLPDDYKKSCMSVWSKYALFPFKGWRARLGSAKYDISMVFTYASVDRYLRDKGKLGFLITQSVFQSDAGHGFRKFYFLNKDGIRLHMHVDKVHDLVEILPFEGASNRTSLIVMTKGKRTSFPIKYVLWKKKSRGEIDQSSTLEETLERVKTANLRAQPVLKTNPRSRWLLTETKDMANIISKIVGKSDYKGLTGSYSEGANGVFWVKLLERFPDGILLVRNLTTGLKVKVDEVTEKIEPDFVYPLLRGGEASKWRVTSKSYLIFTAKYMKATLTESKFKVNYPKTYSYFVKFKDVLDRRSSYVHKMKPAGFPFYTMYGSKKMLAPYKVVWQRMGKKLEAAVLTKKKDPFLGERPVIPQETVIFVPTETKQEAHYLCAVLNSRATILALSRYSMVGGKSFASAHVLNHIKIPKFDRKNKIHRELSKLSKRAHKLIEKDENALIKIENEIDRLVAQLLGLPGIHKLKVLH